MDVLFYSEDDDILAELATPAAAVAGASGGKSCAVVFGEDKRGVASDVATLGVGQVYLVRADGSLRQYPEAVSEALAELVARHASAVVLIGSTKNGKEVAGRLAVKVDAAAATECSSVSTTEQGILIERLAYSGRVSTRVSLKGKFVIACVKARSYHRPAESAAASVMEVGFSPSEIKVKVIETREKAASAVDLTKAEKIVSVGRGMKKKDDLATIQGLADSLGAAVGCSRPLSADLGWLPEEAHIGLTGVQVKPKLYVAVGISGQLQHLAGVKDAGTIVAINTDKGAPIFANADYGIVGDLYQVVPELTRQLNALKHKQ